MLNKYLCIYLIFSDLTVNRRVANEFFFTSWVASKHYSWPT